MAGTSEPTEPPAKRFRYLTKVLEHKWQEGLKKSKLPPGQSEVERYFDSVETLANAADPFDYWVTQQATFLLLSSVALDVLSIPGSSTPVETVFSTAGESTIGKGNGLSDHNLEQEVLPRKNKHLILCFCMLPLLCCLVLFTKKYYWFPKKSWLFIN